MSAYTYAELLQRKANLLSAEAKALQAQAHQSGQGSTARRVDMAQLEQIRTSLADVAREIERHPDNPDNAPGARSVHGRRIRRLRPLY